MDGLNSVHVIVIYCDDLFLNVMPYSFVGRYQHFKETGLHTPANGCNIAPHYWYVPARLYGAVR
jgi:hypothetical protein